MTDKKTLSQEGLNPKDICGATKTPLSLIPPAGLEEIAKAMKNGADKYSSYNWREKKVQYMIYLDAILRHTMALIEREDFAEDSGVHHLGHIGANTCILLDAIKYDSIVDNRPTKPINRNLFDEISQGIREIKEKKETLTLSDEIRARYPETLQEIIHNKGAFACETKQCRCGKQTISPGTKL